MDQIKIGKFIAEKRKAENLTQKQLAGLLSISDKTVSKWECGKGLPEVSLMLQLCETLNITVNDLLSGENVSDIDYQKKAEENMMKLIKENKENKKMMGISLICGIVTIIAVYSLIIIISFIEMPVIARILLIILALATAAVGVGAASLLEVKASYYECPNCGELFKPSVGDYIKGYHTFTKRRLTCPKCGKKGMCRHRVIK